MMYYTNTDFFKVIKNACIADFKATGVCASVTAAQAFIESGCGNSGLTQKANNLFGIKGSYRGCYILMPTKEYNSATKTYYTVSAKFRKYPNWSASISDHSNFLKVNSRYKNLSTTNNCFEQCKMLQQDGYATSPIYANTLTTTIKRFNLQEWDKEVTQATAGKTEEAKVAEKTPQYTEKGYSLYDVKYGDQGEVVKFLQTLLAAEGFEVGAIDGIAGDKTIKAIADFQVKERMTTCGHGTWTNLLDKH